ncbi:Mu transposase C-terminal domain-containing protein [Denitratisoma sp. agr-D3]
MPDRLTLADLSGYLGVSKVAVAQRAKREEWVFEAIPARGGLQHRYELSDLPAPVRQIVVKKRAEAIVSSGAVTAAPLPAAAQAAGFPIPCIDLTDQQRQERDARNGVLAAIKRIQEEAGASQAAAITTLLTSAKAGQTPATLGAMLRLARDPRGRAGDGFPSERTLKRWLAAPDLTPKIVQADHDIPAWANGFLAHFQTPQKPSVEAAYREWVRQDFIPGDTIPASVHQVRRWLAKLGTVTRERGRMGDRELKNIKPFIRRDFSHLEPNDIWTADGHTFDAEVQHPLHGRPFRPEITTFIDIATRQAVGWSVDLAESGMAVVDALRSGVERYGIPAILYVDNGSGYANALMKDEATGLMGRLGCEMRHSLPYNSQARGVIERSHQTIWVQAAKQLPSYVGAEMDREARLQQFKLTRQALKKGGAMPLIPWEVFVQFVEAKVAEYNAQPHRSLKGVSPDLCRRSFEARGWQAHVLGNDHVETLFRPRVIRTIRRGEVELFTNLYFSQALAEFHGHSAQVAYDIHDPSRIWIYTPEGRFICQAEANGNRRHYMPVPVVQQARERRAKGRLARVDAKREEILEELHGAPALAVPSADHLVIGGRVIDPAAISAIQAKPMDEITEPMDETAKAMGGIAKPLAQPAVSRSQRRPEENYIEWQDIDQRILAGEPVTEDEANWHGSYQQTTQYRVLAKRKAAA